jgi:putative ABC transport system substrate-binding protein
MTTRRDFITLLGSAAAAWPLAARAQPVERIRRVAVLIGNAEAEFRVRYQLFVETLARLGCREGVNLRIDYRWTDNKADLADAQARELVGLAPDVIYAAPGPAVEAVQKVTRTIPIVFATSTDPVAAGYVQSYARPGGNLTGFADFEASLNTKWLQLLKDVAPTVSRVALLHADVSVLARARRDFAEVEAAASALGLAAVDAPFEDDPASIERAIETFAREPNGGLTVAPGNLTVKYRSLIVALTNRHRLPAVYYLRAFVDVGGLMSYGTDQIENFRRPATYVDRILRGAKPADLPVQTPTKYELVVKLKTAKALGLAISHEFLLTADDVVE